MVGKELSNKRELTEKVNTVSMMVRKSKRVVPQC